MSKQNGKIQQNRQKKLTIAEKKKVLELADEMPECPGQKKSHNKIVSHVSCKLGRQVSKSTIGNIMRKLMLAQADYPSSKKKKIPRS